MTVRRIPRRGQRGAPRSVRVVVSVTPEEREAIRLLAERRRLTVSMLLRDLARDALVDEGPPAG